MLRNWFFIKTDRVNVKVHLSDILYVKALKNYVRIVTSEKNWMTLLSMKQMEQALPRDSFCRIHRSFIVSLDHLSAFDRQTAWVSQYELPIGENYRHVLERYVIGPNIESLLQSRSVLVDSGMAPEELNVMAC